MSIPPNTRIFPPYMLIDPNGQTSLVIGHGQRVICTCDLLHSSTISTHFQHHGNSEKCKEYKKKKEKDEKYEFVTDLATLVNERGYGYR